MDFSFDASGEGDNGYGGDDVAGHAGNDADEKSVNDVQTHGEDDVGSQRGDVVGVSRYLGDDIDNSVFVIITVTLTIMMLTELGWFD